MSSQAEAVIAFGSDWATCGGKRCCVVACSNDATTMVEELNERILSIAFDREREVRSVGADGRCEIVGPLLERLVGSASE